MPGGFCEGGALEADWQIVDSKKNKTKQKKKPNVIYGRIFNILKC